MLETIIVGGSTSFPSGHNQLKARIKILKRDIKQKRRYWLMKSEPDCFSLTDLKNSGIEAWDGVRNYQARNLLRDEIKVDDGVLFYHSRIAQPGIVGVARIVREGYPDLTALDPASSHFDPRSTEQHPIWYMVDVQFIAALPRPLVRDELRQHPVLAGMGVLKKGNRLSVQPVTEEEWRTILELVDLRDPLPALESLDKS